MLLSTNMAMAEFLRPAPNSIDALGVVRIMREYDIDVASIMVGMLVDSRDLERFVQPLAQLKREVPLARENFPEGDTGETALFRLESATNCEAVANEPCSNKPVLTLDYNMLWNEYEQTPLCMSHLEHAMVAIHEDVAKQGRKVSFGINGWGGDFRT